jgi:hypothetical protein
MTPFEFGWAVHDGLLLREKQAFPGASFWRGLMRTGAKAAPQVAKQAPRTAAEMAQELQRAARTARPAVPVTRPPVVAKPLAARPPAVGARPPAIPRLPAAPAVPATPSARSLVSPTAPAPSVASAADDFDVKKFLELVDVPAGATLPKGPGVEPDPMWRHLHRNDRAALDESTRALFPESAQEAIARVRSQPLLQSIKAVGDVPVPPVRYLPPNTPLRYPVQ